MLGLVVPFFANEDYLVEMITSIRRQDSNEWQSLIVDDSINGLSQKTQNWILADERFSIHRNAKNVGAAKAWNLGLAEAVGRWPRLEVISVVHADDRLHPAFVRRSLGTHRKFPEAIAVHTAVATMNYRGRVTVHVRDVAKRVLRPGNFTTYFVSVRDEGLAQILRGNFVFCPSLSYKTLGLELPLFSEGLQQTMDLELLSRLLFTGRPIVGLKDRLYYYRRHEQSLTFRNEENGGRFVEEASMYAAISQTARSRNFFESAYVASKMNIVLLHCLYLLVRAALKVDPSKFQLMKREVVTVLRTRRAAMAYLD